MQTDADRERVVEALGGLRSAQHDALDKVLRDLAPRWFVVRDAQSEQSACLLQPRWAMSYLRGLMTRNEIKRAVKNGTGTGTESESESKSESKSKSGSESEAEAEAESGSEAESESEARRAAGAPRSAVSDAGSDRVSL